MNTKGELDRRVSALEARTISKSPDEDQQELKRMKEILAQYDLADPEKKYIEQARRVREERGPHPKRVWTKEKGWDRPLDMEYEVACYVHLLPEVKER